MFNNKKNSLVNVHFHSGIYKFELPYLSNNNVPDENGIVPVYNCDVEMHIGDQRDLDNGFIASIIISAKKKGVGTTNFIEHLATTIKKEFIDGVVRPQNGSVHGHIRWIERNHYPKENFQLVKLEWDEKEQSYHTPKWLGIDENDWILTNHRLNPYE